MRTIKRASLKTELVLKGITYIPYSTPTSEIPVIKRLAKIEETRGRKTIMVEVHKKSLDGRTDLHGKPYQPSRFLFVESKETPIKEGKR